MQPSPLLTIKTNIPAPKGKLLDRPRLVDQIEQGMQSNLVLVSAPAGFGKTTAVVSWIQVTDRNVAWLALDRDDNDPALFFRYLISTIQRLEPEFGLGIQLALESQPNLQPDSLLANFINELAALDFPISLVFDDYHIIETEAIHRILKYLIQHIPFNANIVIISRIDPPIPLGRLRAGGELTEIRSKDLRFRADEGDAFFNDLMNLGLSKGEAAALHARTEGWIVGLQLAALSLRDREDKQAFIERFSGTHQYIIDYLLEEVLAGLPEGIKSFLYRISILDRFCAPLCDAMLDRSDSRRVISELAEIDLFLVPLDADDRWFRFHHLFVDFLRHASRHDQELLSKLHSRASEWFEAQGEPTEAILHRVRAGDYAEAARILESIGMQMLENSELSALIGLIELIPHDQACSRPWVCIYHAWALRLSGGAYQEVEDLLDCAEKAIGPIPSNDRSGPGDEDRKFAANDKGHMRAHLTAIGAFQALYREDVPAVIQLAQDALSLRPEGNFIRSSIALSQGWAYRFSGNLAASSQSLQEARSVGLSSGNTFLTVSATCRLAYNELLMGRLHAAADLCRQALQLSRLGDNKRLPVAGYAHVYLGYIHYLWNELDAAKEHLSAGIELCRQVGYIMDQIVGHSLQARVFHALGEPELADEALSQGERLCDLMKGYLYARRWMDDSNVRNWGATGKLDAVRSWVKSCGLSTADPPTFMREIEEIILARALLNLSYDTHNGSIPDDLIPFMDRIREAAGAAGWVSKEIEILILQSLAIWQMKDKERSLAVLESALKLAEPEGFIRPFLDEGELARKLLSELTSSSETGHFSRKLLDAFDKNFITSGTVDGGKASSALIEPLSRRELEVLQLLATDLSGPEIADKLVIAVSTFRYHTDQIYKKLAVHNRREAVTRGKELEII